MSSTDAAGYLENFRRLVGGSTRFAGPLLMAAAGLALIVANSPLAPHYFAALEARAAGMTALHWINDGLMAVFFLLVGLEIKRELLIGELSTRDQRIVPAAAALGGMVGPAIVYLCVNQGSDGHPSGWAIPAATDIAFALGVLALLGPRVPVSLKIFLTALAIIDDLGAIAIIALFYSSEISSSALTAAGVTSAALIVLNRRGVVHLAPYILLGVALWVCVLNSGIHATLAGVVLALTVPLKALHGRSPLLQLEHSISPLVALFVLPVFGFANAGVSFGDVTIETLLQPVPLGISLGLFFGKQLGVFAAAFVVIRLGLGKLPAQSSWKDVYAISVLCGIGFTMSLFIGTLAFPNDNSLQEGVKLGVFVGSIVSALIAALLFVRRA